jgi:primosomal protein N' (replication factor Y)
VKDHDVHSFYKQEIRYREHFGYPPYSRLIKVIFKHQDEPKAIAAATQMTEALKPFEGIILQGPAPAIVPRVRNQFIHEIWIKCPRDNKLLDNLKSLLKKEKSVILSKKGNTNVQLIFDVDPY